MCPPDAGKFVVGVVLNILKTVAMIMGKTTQVLLPCSITRVSGGQVSIWIVNDHKYPVILKQEQTLLALKA